jgi:DNA polymerase-3 subunit beta
MKFSVARSELSDALSVASRGLSARSTLPILSGILVTCSQGRVKLQTTDLEVSVRTHVAGLVEEEGQAVLPGRLFSDIVRSMPEAAISVSVDKEVALVSSSNASFTLKTLPADDFPKFPEVTVDKKVSLPSEVVSSMVRQVSRAVSRDETRAILTGVLLSIEGHTIRMVATDSYRLAVREVLLDEAVVEAVEVVVPGKALEEVTKLLGGHDLLQLGVSENQIVCEFGDTTFVTRRIEGTFPNYKQLIPKETQTTVRVPSEEIAAAVKRVSLMAQHNTPLRLSVNSEDQTLSLSATTQDVGDASEDLMSRVDGPDVEIAFNHTFLMDGLASVATEETRLEIVSPLKPGIIKPGEGEDYLYLLMPVRLG